ncbi:alpha/beta fold hydrolase [Dawidia soli]|uniref:Alpha/beta hydrolase n=1 Tax=Dawidia soli TaxID=2782352 RepID=A0AAP2GL78_9BACT|nr:alpha/beta hydrolase [Dawidia soli]MBT1690320.1 alpha/beta hydrolase [Dawidia soli]
MGYVQVNSLTGREPVDIYYEDLGQGQPVVLIHGWPSSHEMWEYQIGDLVNAGFRVIAYDRRGFGKSSKPFEAYDYDTLTADLKALLDHLHLDDVTLVGFSMGGGEVVRYFSRYGGARVIRAVLIGSVTPYMLKTADNPDGVDESVFVEILANIKDDRMAFLETFGKQFFGINLINKPVSTPYLEYFRMLAAVASPKATQECAKAFAYTDFRGDMAAVNVPTLIIHGDSDKTVPIETSGDQSSRMITGSRYIRYAHAPHGLFYTEKERLNADLISFIREPVAAVTY